MKTFIFLCVILSCSGVTGLDLNASKYVGWDFSSFHHFNNIIKINQNKFPRGQFPHSFPITILRSSCSLYENMPLLCGTNLRSSCTDVNSHNKVVVCYTDGWAWYRPGNGEFLVENINPMLCTHIIYAFADLDSDTHSIQSESRFVDKEFGHGIGNK